MNLTSENFNWGPTSEYCKKFFSEEIFEKNTYEKFFKVELDDIVVDIGSSVGEFTYSVLHKSPKHCYVVEPVNAFFDVLKENLQGYPVSFSKCAISSDKHLIIEWDSFFEKAITMTFKEYRESLNLHKIDFLKIDCEGGEYNVFSEENVEFLKTVPKIVAEFHLHGVMGKAKFRNFRDTILKKFEKYHIRSTNDVDIGWDLWNDHFIDYYSEVLIYIDNRKQ